MVTIDKWIEPLNEFATFCSNPDHVRDLILSPSNKNPAAIFSNVPIWSDLSFVEGFPSLLIFYSTLNSIYPNSGWDNISHRYVLRIKDSIEKSGIPQSASLYGGLAGICFAIHFASHHETRYMRLLNKLESILLEQIETNYLHPLRANFEQGLPHKPHLYELIQGLAGIGLFLLLRKSQVNVHMILKEVIHWLCKLSHPIDIESHQVPGWFVPNDALFLQEDKVRFPSGNFNIGLSHGITGVLSFLSIAYLQGVIENGHKEAIETICSWLHSKRIEVDDYVFWSGAISFKDEIDRVKANKLDIYNRDAWCYGTPGVTRSLFLAGKALQNNEIKHFALDSFRSLLKRPLETHRLSGPIICHGIAGNLLITDFMYRDSNDAFFGSQIRRLETILWDYYDIQNRLGFCDLVRNEKGNLVKVHKAGLLEGASGIWLTLLRLKYSTAPWYFPFAVNDV